jgi:hypothetical protein
MRRTRYAWRDAYVAALRESDPMKLLARIQQATSAIEMRHAEWESNPGTPAELKAIQKAISTLRSLLKGEEVRRRAS